MSAPPPASEPPGTSSLSARLQLLPVRIAIVVFVGIWCLVEWFWWGDPLFQWLTLFAFVYAVWSQLISYKPPPPDGDEGPR
jgi:predicted membrane channel-forming protein YqfA (hemolysin III family)